MPTAAVTHTSTEFRIAAPNPEVVQASTQFSTCSSLGRPHGSAQMLEWVRRALRKIQATTARLKPTTSQTTAEAILRPVLVRRADRCSSEAVIVAPPHVGSGAAAGPPGGSRSPG